MGKAVAAVLGQELPASYDLEVLIAVSDPACAADVASANELAHDPQVKVVLSQRRGAGAARNAALEMASGSVLAFTDDDCEVQPGWLMAALRRLQEADLVQGRTVPAGRVDGWDHYVRVDPPSWLWETCNLVCTRQAATLAGRFDESWNAAGLPGNQFGEDVDWGWRMIRAGARPAFEPEALVHHAVVRRNFNEFLVYRARRLGTFPRLFRVAPEVRRRFYLGYFVDRHHVVIVASTGLVLGGIAARAIGARRKGWLLSMLGGAIYLWPYRSPLLRLKLRSAYHQMKYPVIQDAVDFLAVIFGSVKWRRGLL